MKAIFLENLGTKATALGLALLTWAYLFTQGQDEVDIDVEFVPPALTATAFASITYKTADGRPLTRGSLLRVKLSGPRDDISRLAILAPGHYTCSLPVDPKEMNAPEGKGTLQIPLVDNHFDIPKDFTIRPSQESVTIDYVLYQERTITLLATKYHRDGNPAPGYTVDSITTLPSQIKAMVPADLSSDRTEFEIKEVPVEGKQLDFTLENWELAEKPGVQSIKPLEPFRVEVKIVAKPYSELIPNLRLSLNCKPESLARIVLETKSITIAIQGPEELVREAKERPTAFLPYVVVTDADLATPGNKNLPVGQIGCYVQDPNYKSLRIIYMADIERPENRQVKVKILPKPPGQD